MICPECGERAHRSHSRNFQETVIKKVSPYKAYRCSRCGWRGMAAPVKTANRSGRLRSLFFWIAGLIIALIIGIYAAYDLQSSTLPRK
jgi:hypothetical protein